MDIRPGCCLYKKKGMHRAADMSWYTSKDKAASFCSMFIMITFMIVSVFVRLKAGPVWFFPGLVMVLAGFAAHISSKVVFGKTESTQAVTGGMYKVSRNPMYASLSLVFLGAVIASQSIVLAVLWILMAAATHVLIRSEEQYCIKTYGDSFREYMRKTPRYFLFF